MLVGFSELLSFFEIMGMDQNVRIQKPYRVVFKHHMGQNTSFHGGIIRITSEHSTVTHKKASVGTLGHQFAFRLHIMTVLLLTSLAVDQCLTRPLR